MGNSSSVDERIDRQQRQINSQNNRINNLQTEIADLNQRDSDFIDDLAEINSSQTRELNNLKSSSSVNQSNINNNNNLINQWRNEARQSITAIGNRVSRFQANVSSLTDGLSSVRNNMVDLEERISQNQDAIEGPLRGAIQNLSDAIVNNEDAIMDNRYAIEVPIVNSIKNITDVINENHDTLSLSSFVKVNSEDDLELMTDFNSVPEEYRGHYDSVNKNLAGLTLNAVVINDKQIIFSNGDIIELDKYHNEQSNEFEELDSNNFNTLFDDRYQRYSDSFLNMLRSQSTNEISRSYQVLLYKNKQTQKLEVIKLIERFYYEVIDDDGITQNDIRQGRFIHLLPGHILFSIGGTDLETFLKINPKVDSNISLLPKYNLLKKYP